VPFGIGPAELMIVLVLALIILGPKRLPEVGRSIGSGMREFKDSVSGGKRQDDDDDFDMDVAARRVESTTTQAK
jgi:sec-independent protein translocase protein TatA